jgi:hypothetical protein
VSLAQVYLLTASIIRAMMKAVSISDTKCTLTFVFISRMFFGGYDDDDDVKETSSQLDEFENFEDVVPELDLGEPPNELKEYARLHLGESPDTRPSMVQELRNMIYGQYSYMLK